MPGEQFDSELTFPSEKGGILAKGPLQKVQPPNSLKSIYVWISQTQDDGTCAAAVGKAEARDKDGEPNQRLLSLAGTGSWEVECGLEGDPNPALFIAGPALAFAIAVFDIAGVQKTFWWGQNVMIVLDR